MTMSARWPPSLEATPAFARARDYWHARLSDLPPGPALPRAAGAGTDRPVRIGARAQRIAKARWQRLRASAFRWSVTPTVMLTAVFCDLLRAWGAAERFTLNLPIFDRERVHPDVLGIVGDFTTTLLVAADKADGSFADRAQALQQQLWEDLEHRQFGGIRVIRELIRTGRQAIGAPMPVVITSLLDQPPRAEGGSLGTELHVLSQTPQVLLDFQLREVDGDLLLHWAIMEGLVSTEAIDAMFAEYLELLDRFIDDETTWEVERFELGPRNGAVEFVAANREPGLLVEPSATLVDFALERAVAGMLEGLFDVDLVGRDEDLFRSGLDLLALIRWAGRINEMFMIELPLERVFERATVAGVSSLILERADWRERAVATVQALEALTLEDVARMTEAQPS